MNNESYTVIFIKKKVEFTPKTKKITMQGQ